MKKDRVYLSNVLRFGIAQQSDFVGVQLNNVIKQVVLQQSNKIA